MRGLVVRPFSEGKLELSFFCKMFVFGTGPEDKRTAWIPCSAGCSRKRRCSASASAWFRVVLEYITGRGTLAEAASVNCIHSTSVWKEIVIQFLVEEI